MPMIFLKNMYQLNLAEIYQAVAKILTGAIRFSIQPCEYLKKKMREE